MSIVTCPNCGVTDEARYSFCSHCGKLFPDGFEETTEGAATAENSDKSIDVEPEGYRETFSWLRDGQQNVGQQSASQQESKHPGDERADDGVLGSSHLDEDESQPDRTRTLNALPNLLEPLSVASLLTIDESTDSDQGTPSSPNEAIRTGDHMLRQIRQLMAGEPTIVDQKIRTGSRLGQNSPTSLRIPWVFWLLGLMLGVPIFLQLTFPGGDPQALPGVEETFNTVDQLVDGAEILVIWAVDPATSGEMDLVAQPLIYHLLKQRNPMSVVSLFPTGPASVQALLQKLSIETDIGLIDPIVSNYGFLAGGSTILPLLGQNLAVALKHGALVSSRSVEVLQARESQVQPLPNPNPKLVLIVAAQAEDVQHWLEQAQPLNQVPVVAAVGAAADFVLRPYLDSQQLSGIVSGFDGGGVYQALLDRTEDAPLAASTLPAAVRQRQQLVFQNWGHLAFLLLIFLGNFSLLISRSNDEGRVEPLTNPSARMSPGSQSARGGLNG